MNQQLMLFLLEVALQLGVPSYRLRRWLPRYMHILAERKAMTRRLWLETMFKDDWTCYLCGVRNFKNQDPTRDKMEAEHVVSLYHYGRTVPANLRAACRSCNRKKGVRLVSSL